MLGVLLLFKCVGRWWFDFTADVSATFFQNWDAYVRLSSNQTNLPTFTTSASLPAWFGISSQTVRGSRQFSFLRFVLASRQFESKSLNATLFVNNSCLSYRLCLFTQYTVLCTNWAWRLMECEHGLITPTFRLMALSPWLMMTPVTTKQSEARTYEGFNAGIRCGLHLIATRRNLCWQKSARVSIFLWSDW